LVKQIARNRAADLASAPENERLTCQCRSARLQGLNITSLCYAGTQNQVTDYLHSTAARHCTPERATGRHRRRSSPPPFIPVASESEALALKQVPNISIFGVQARDGLRVGHCQGASQPEEARRRFPNGAKVFLDPHVIEFDDLDTTDELRFNAIGLVDGRMLFVTYTMRGDLVRIISARGAEPHEKRKYHEI
jgi:uncharacterized DUF497 family protein